MIELNKSELQNVDGGSTCPSMGDYYCIGMSTSYTVSFLKGFIKGLSSIF